MELEVCVDSLISAKAAVNGGADRLELCAGLHCDGLTPSIGFCRKIKEFCGIPSYAIIRPRPGDFIYDNEELDVMLYDIDHLKEYADGFVIGCLRESGDISVDQTGLLIVDNIISGTERIGSYPIIFHRAIDASRNPLITINSLIQLAKQYMPPHCPFRVLTSGGSPAALEGSDVIRQLVGQVASSGIQIMAGGGITELNVQEILDKTNVRAIHGSFSVSRSQAKCTVVEVVRNVRNILDKFDRYK